MKKRLKWFLGFGIIVLGVVTFSLLGVMKFKVGPVHSVHIVNSKVQQHFFGHKPQAIPENHAQGNTEKQIDSRLQHVDFVGNALVVKNGKVIFEKSYGQSDDCNQISNKLNSTFEINSIQKIFTGVLVAKTISSGKLNYNDRLSKFYPQIRGSKSITIRQMLDMTSGLSMDPVGPNFMVSDKKILEWDSKHVIQDPKLINKWGYAGVNYNLLSGILEKVTGKSYKQLFEQTFVRSLKLRQTGFVYDRSLRNQRAIGYTNSEGSTIASYREAINPAPWAAHDELGTGQIYMSARDLYCAERAIMQGRVLSQSERKRLEHPGSSRLYGGGTYVFREKGVTFMQNHGFGYGFESMSDISEDGQTGVILLSNYYRPSRSIRPLSTLIFEQIASNEWKG